MPSSISRLPIPTCGIGFPVSLKLIAIAEQTAALQQSPLGAPSDVAQPVTACETLLERLDSEDAADLSLNAGDVTYTVLADLPTATDKARRDAPAIAVCEI